MGGNKGFANVRNCINGPELKLSDGILRIPANGRSLGMRRSPDVDVLEPQIEFIEGAEPAGEVERPGILNEHDNIGHPGHIFSRHHNDTRIDEHPVGTQKTLRIL